jgi:hypothetical protein
MTGATYAVAHPDGLTPADELLRNHSTLLPPFACSAEGVPLVAMAIKGGPLTIFSLGEARELCLGLQRVAAGEPALRMTTGRGNRDVLVSQDGDPIVFSINGVSAALAPADVEELIEAIRAAHSAAQVLPEVVDPSLAAPPIPLDRATMTDREIEIMEAFGLHAKS